MSEILRLSFQLIPRQTFPQYFRTFLSVLCCIFIQVQPLSDQFRSNSRLILEAKFDDEPEEESFIPESYSSDFKLAEAAVQRCSQKRCSENMQQIYRRTLLPKCDFNKVALMAAFVPSYDSTSFKSVLPRYPHFISYSMLSFYFGWNS